MQYEISNHQVLIVEEVITSTQKAITKRHFCMYRKVKLDCPVNPIGLNQPLEIRFTWQKFDLDSGEYVDDTDSTDPLQVDIDGQKVIMNPENGVDLLTFSSGEPGPVVIKTENPLVSNAILEVTVSA